MAAPSRVASNIGTVITTGSAGVALSGGVADDVMLLQVLQDGTAASAVSLNTIANMKDLDGADPGMTLVTGSPFNVGSPTAALQHLWLARKTGTSLATVNVATTGDDLYCQIHRFADVNTAVGLTNVIENSTAGTATNGVGTSITVADTAVTTLGADRLALNLVGINDDLTGIAAFAGMTGGTWAMPTTFESSTGTDGTVALMTATMATAGTIDGGTDTITSDGWGVVGFALIGTTAAGGGFVDNEALMVLQAVNRSNVY